MSARVASLVSLALAFAACAPPAQRPARVVLVTIDTLRADRVGAYGAQDARTPTLDALARDGVRFDAAISPVPLTLPSHATILTGLDPDQHGVRHNSVFVVPPELPTLAERARESGLATAGFVGAFVLDRRFGLARGFDVYDDAMGEQRSGRAVVGFAERRAEEVVDSFLAWLEKAPDRFFAWIHVYDPHAAYDPPTAFSLGFAGRLYDGEIAYVDSQLGRLVSALDARFGPDGTLVVVTSDHGESLGEHEPSHSYSLYEATQRVPLILRGPGFRGGRAVPDVVRLADVAPTLVAAIGAAPLAPGVGRDLAPLLRGGAEPVRAYAETVATHYDYGWSALFAVRDARWRYVEAPEPELYDLRADPAEKRNVVREHADVARDFSAWLGARRAAARSGEADEASLSDEERARLESLGYVVGSGSAVRSDLSGPDPKSRMHVLAALERAEWLGSQGRWGDAHAQLAPLDETGETFLSIRGSFALNAGRLEDAERDAVAALQLSPDRPELVRLLGQVRERARDSAGARSLYERAASLDPTDASALASLGRIAEAESQREEAERRYRAALERQPRAADPLWRLAALLFERGDATGARALLEDPPDPPDPLVALRVAGAEAEAGRVNEAAALLERGLRRGDLPAAVVAPAGALLEAGGRPDAALRIYEKALRSAPDSWPLQNGIAWVLANEGRDLDRALDLARAAVRGSQDEPAVLDTLATVELRRGDPEAALRTADRALPRADAAVRPHLHFVRARALEALGRRAHARSALARALAEAGDPPPRWHAEAIALGRSLDSDTSAAASPP